MSSHDEKFNHMVTTKKKRIVLIRDSVVRQQLPSLPQFYIQLFPHVKKPVKMKAILNHHSRKKSNVVFNHLKKNTHTHEMQNFFIRTL